MPEDDLEQPVLVMQVRLQKAATDSIRKGPKYSAKVMFTHAMLALHSELLTHAYCSKVLCACLEL